MSDKQSPLDLLEILGLLVGVLLGLGGKLPHVLGVGVLIKGKLGHVLNDLLERLREADEPLHKLVLVSGLLLPQLNFLGLVEQRLLLLRSGGSHARLGVRRGLGLFLCRLLAVQFGLLLVFGLLDLDWFGSVLNALDSRNVTVGLGFGRVAFREVLRVEESLVASPLLDSVEVLEVLDPEVAVEIQVGLTLGFSLQIDVVPLKGADDLQ